MRIREYLAVLYEDWMALMSGIAAVVLAFLYAYWSPPPEVVRTLLLIASLICLFIASYRVWLKERQARLKDQEGWRAELTQVQARLEAEKAKVKSELETENTELLSQLEVEKAKNAKPEIIGNIQEILINDTHTVEGKRVGAYVTIGVAIVNARPIPTRVKSFKLRMKVKDQTYESVNFYRNELYRERYKRRQEGKSDIKNLADSINLPRGLELNLTEEGYIRFFVEGLYPSQPIIHDEGYHGPFTEDMLFSLEDIKEVTLIVSDYFTDYEIVASEIRPEWKNIIS
jgi:hypothetical protein